MAPALVLACHDAAAPAGEEPNPDPFEMAACPVGAPCLIATGSIGPPPTGNHRAFVIDPVGGRVLGWMGPLLGNQGLSSLSPDQRTLVVMGWDSVGTLIAGIDVHSGDFRWIMRRPGGGTALKFYLPSFVVPSLDSRSLYYIPVDSADTPGFVALSASTHEVQAFRPIEVAGRFVSVLTAGLRFPAGTLTLHGILSPGPQIGRILFLSPDLEIIDSVSTPEFARNTVITPDETTAYYMSGFVLAKVDLISKQIVKRIPLRGHWFIAVHPDGNSVYAQEFLNYQASPLLEFTPDLTLRRSIPLQQVEDYGWSPVVTELVFDPSGQTAYVLTGLTDPFYFIEPGAVRVVDLAAGSLTKVIRLHQSGLQSLHLIRP